jgi:hypothetical protein
MTCELVNDKAVSGADGLDQNTTKWLTGLSIENENR